MGPNDNPEDLRSKFWERFSLEDLNRAEWEAVCDGCGKCCLIKLDFDDGHEVQYTNVACRLFDDSSCRCSQYALRRQLVPGCVVVTAENIETIAHWMPETCAYRLLQDGQKLKPWHPLISGDSQSVVSAGVSVMGKTIPEYDVDEDDLEDYVIKGLL